MENRRSLWERTAEIPRREALKGDLRADVAVIGAGLAGVLIARALKDRGARVVVLEADGIAGGQTGGTTAKITSQHGMIYDSLISKFGVVAAAQYARMNERAIADYAEIIERRKIDCDFREAPAYLYTTKDPAPMRREAEAAAGLGLPARFAEQTELPFPVAGAVRFDGQAMFHPLKFIRAISEDLEIFERTRALEADDHAVRTPRGVVTADHIVFASHFPFVNAPGFYFLRMHQERSYVLAVRCGFSPRGIYLGVDEDGLSFRAAEGLLLLGGESHRTGENGAGGQYERLARRAEALFPGCAEAARWSAQDCIPIDGVPYIGRFSRATPSWYVATGFQKWGMTSSMVAATVIPRLIAGEAADEGEVFSPLRFHLSASGRSLAVETAQACKGLAREAFMPPRAALDALPIGHGGIVDAGDGKAGAYKDERGRCHVVGSRCPHLNCQVEWNPEEKSWDCPCHGSRFSPDGAPLNGPAQEGLT